MYYTKWYNTNWYNTKLYPMKDFPFIYGLTLSIQSFTNRETELTKLQSDLLNGIKAINFFY